MKVPPNFHFIDFKTFDTVWRKTMKILKAVGVSQRTQNNEAYI